VKAVSHFRQNPDKYFFLPYQVVTAENSKQEPSFPENPHLPFDNFWKRISLKKIILFRKVS